MAAPESMYSLTLADGSCWLVHGHWLRARSSGQIVAALHAVRDALTLALACRAVSAVNASVAPESDEPTQPSSPVPSPEGHAHRR